MTGKKTFVPNLKCGRRKAVQAELEQRAKPMQIVYKAPKPKTYQDPGTKTLLRYNNDNWKLGVINTHYHKGVTAQQRKPAGEGRTLGRVEINNLCNHFKVSARWKKEMEDRFKMVLGCRNLQAAGAAVFLAVLSDKFLAKEIDSEPPTLIQIQDVCDNPKVTTRDIRRQFSKYFTPKSP